MVAGFEFDVIVQADHVQSLVGAELKLNYDPALFDFIGAIPSPEFEGCTVEINSTVAGVVNLIIFGTAFEGVSGGPLDLWEVTLFAKSEAATTDMAITETLLGNISTIPSQGRTATFLVVAGECGDLNLDGAISMLDAIIELRIVAEFIRPTQAHSFFGDLDGDEDVSVLDALGIARHIVGLEIIDRCGPL